MQKYRLYDKKIKRDEFKSQLFTIGKRKHILSLLYYLPSIFIFPDMTYIG